jgi:hypothetical protein
MAIWGPPATPKNLPLSQNTARVDQHEALMTARAAPSDITSDFNQRATPVTAMPPPLVQTGPQAESRGIPAPLAPAATGEVPLAPSNTSNTFSSFFQPSVYYSLSSAAMQLDTHCVAKYHVLACSSEGHVWATSNADEPY